MGWEFNAKTETRISYTLWNVKCECECIHIQWKCRMQLMHIRKLYVNCTIFFPFWCFDLSFPQPWTDDTTKTKLKIKHWVNMLCFLCRQTYVCTVTLNVANVAACKQFMLILYITWVTNFWCGEYMFKCKSYEPKRTGNVWFNTAEKSWRILFLLMTYIWTTMQFN